MLLKNVAIVGTETAALHGSGKMQPATFLPVFEDELRRSGRRLFTYRQVDRFLPVIEDHRNDVVLAIWNEEQNKPTYEQTVQEVDGLERACERHGIPVINGLSIGRIVGNKAETNKTLGAVIPMPAVVADGPAFSAAPSGSSQRVKIIEAGSTEAEGRYNVEFVDTIHEFDGTAYYLSLRAMAVGPELISILSRCRPVADGDMAVHAVDTPLDPGLLEHWQATIVEPKRAEIAEICRRAGMVLGAGLFAYDILPERSTGKLFVSEVGLKVQESSVPKRIASIAGQVGFYEQELGATAWRRTSRAFIRQFGGTESTFDRMRRAVAPVANLLKPRTT